MLYADRVVVSPGCDVRGIINGAMTAAGGCVAQSISAKLAAERGRAANRGRPASKCLRDVLFVR